MLFRTLFLSVAITLVGITAAVAQPVNYQGRLLDDAGVPITSSTVARFSIYEGGDDSTAGSGTLVYSEVVTIHPDSTGIFSHLIGVTPEGVYELSPDLFQTSNPVFLQINIPFDGSALLPRTLLVSVPRALTANQLSAEETIIPIPVLGVSVLYGAGADPSDDISDLYGLRLEDDVNHLVVADGLLPLSWTGDVPGSIRVTAEIMDTLPIAGLRTALFSFRLHGAESGAAWTFEGTHEFSGTGPEVFELPRVVTSGTFIPGESVSWTYQRRYNIPSDTLARPVILLGAQMRLMMTR